MPDIENTKFLIVKLNDDKKKNMRIIINENDYINEIPEFAKYDKNLEMGLNLIN